MDYIKRIIGSNVLLFVILMPNPVFKINALAPIFYVVIKVLDYIKRIIGSNVLLFVINIITTFILPGCNAFVSICSKI